MSEVESLGPHGSSLVGDHRAAFGRRLFHLLPEDVHDRQPSVEASGTLYVGDVRIDNRGEMEAELGLSASTRCSTSDAGLLFKCWEAWGIEGFTRVVGDFAAACWNPAARELILYRSPLAMKPLYFVAQDGLCAFSTLPAPLASVLAHEAQPDFMTLARVISLAPRDDFGTAFARVERVHPGYMVRVTTNGVQRTRLWQPRIEPLFRGSAEEAGEGLRTLFSAAVKAQARRHGGRLATQLSSGRDSSAVTGIAATITGEQLLAFTGAPRRDYSEKVFEGWVADESAVAAKTSQLYPNIDHRVCRWPGSFALERLLDVQRQDQRPLYQPSQMPWWTAINDAACAEGATVMLTGSLGNLTISAGGQPFLVDLLHSGGLREWARQGGRMAGRSPRRWLSILNGSFGPSLPTGLYTSLRRIAGRATSPPLRILRQPYRSAMEEACAEHSSQPPRTQRQARLDLLLRQDGGQKITLRMWGMDVRDPTADKRVVEFCLALPPELLLDGANGRPVYDRAFAHVVAPEVLRPSARGYQQADWHELFDPEQLRMAFRRFAREPAVGELIDLEYAEGLLAEWPRAGWDKWEQVHLYRDQLLTAFSAAAFIAEFFGSNGL